jgi:hypothetical protein
VVKLVALINLKPAGCRCAPFDLVTLSGFALLSVLAMENAGIRVWHEKQGGHERRARTRNRRAREREGCEPSPSPCKQLGGERFMAKSAVFIKSRKEATGIHV